MARVTADTLKFIDQVVAVPTILGGSPWTTLYEISDTVPLSGIYRCHGCGDEITCNRDDGFPPQNHHQHPDPAVPVQWQLIVSTKTK